jgi:hypothetical protein
MRKFKVAAVILACACALRFTGAHAQAQTRQAAGWRRIVPLQSKRADVLRRLGKPSGGGDLQASYKLKGEDVIIRYAEGDACRKEGGDGWRVRRGTVLQITVRPQNLRLSDLRLDPRRYRKEMAGDTQAVSSYRDERAGVAYEVSEADGYVRFVTYGPAARDSRLRCPAPR